MVQKTVLITGCSEGGIGDALAKNFHAKGHRVFATARNLKKVQHLKELGLDIILLDVTDEDSISQAVEAVKKLTGGKLDILVNNSGAGKILPSPHITCFPHKLTAKQGSIFHYSTPQSQTQRNCTT
jgi:1-acylglycerone phosphate reductase